MSLTPAERQRIRRQRKRSGALVVRVSVKPEARAVLADARWIGAWDEDDPAAVQEAIQRLIDGLQPVRSE